MPKGNKAKSKTSKAQKAPENQIPEPENSESLSDSGQRLPEREVVQSHEQQNLQHPQSENPDLAEERPLDATLGESQPIEEPPIAPTMENDPPLANINETSSAEPDAENPTSSGENGTETLQDHFKPSQSPGPETVQSPLPHFENDEKNVENSAELAKAITDHTHSKPFSDSIETEDNTANGTVVATSDDMASEALENTGQASGDVSGSTENYNIDGRIGDQHRDTIDLAETTVQEAPNPPKTNEQPTSTEITKPTEPFEPEEPKEQENTIQDLAESAQTLALTEEIEPTGVVDTTGDIAPAESRALTEVLEPTGASEPTVRPGVGDTLGSIEPEKSTVSTETTVEPTQSVSNPVMLDSPSEERAQVTTGHAQSNVGLPIFESSSPLPHASRTATSASPYSPSTESAPNAALSGNTQSSVPKATSTSSAFPIQLDGSSADYSGSPSSSTPSPITPVTPAQRDHPHPYKFVHQTQQSTPLQPIQLPSPVQPAVIRSQKGAPPTPPSDLSASRASAFVQQAIPPSQTNGASIPNQLVNPVSRFQVLASPIQESTYLTRKASPAPQPSSPALRAYSPLPTAENPPVYPHHTSMLSARPPLPQHLAHPAPMMHPNSYPPHGSAFAAALQSPALSTGFLPPYTQSPYVGTQSFPQHSPQAHPYGHQRQYIGHPNPNYPNSFQGFQDPSIMSGLGIDSKGVDKGFGNKENMPPLDGDGEPLQLLQRIQDAIPDMGRLLHGYKMVKSQLSSREAELKQIRTQNEQAVMRKDFYIEALQTQLRKTTQENAEETHKLKSTVKGLHAEISNGDEKHKDRDQMLLEAQKSNQQLSQWRSELESHISTLDSDLKDVQEGHEKEIEKLKEDHTNGLVVQKSELEETFEGVRAGDKRAHEEALVAREKELLDLQDSMGKDLENQKGEIQQAHDSLQAIFDTKVAELESTQTELSTMKANLDAKHAELGTTCEAHAKEIQAINDGFNKKQQQWEEHRVGLEMQISQKADELFSNERERERLEGVCENKEEQLRRAIEEMNETMENMNADCGRLKKTLAGFGEITDIKNSKGDTFFLDCFGQLSHQIASLAEDYFAYLPNDPPKDILSKIPPELPSFLDNTAASCELRSAYIQHIISETLNRRVFQPFLFTLHNRSGKESADAYLQALSIDIRRKSVRREALWRQQTLRAAYTASDAKQSINAVAGRIVDEIMQLIKPFADPRPGHLDTLGLAVRRIVKLSAETWRLARVEREFILAFFPAPDAEDVTNGEWAEFGTHRSVTGIGSDVSSPTSNHSVSGDSGRSNSRNPSQQVLLRVLPRIVREAAHGDFMEMGDQDHAVPCVYSAGEVLYSDSPVVMARRQELAR